MTLSRLGKPCRDSIPPLSPPFFIAQTGPCAMNLMYSFRLDDPIIIFATTNTTGSIIY